jgi:hypothetical protein
MNHSKNRKRKETKLKTENLKRRNAHPNWRTSRKHTPLLKKQEKKET